MEIVDANIILRYLLEDVEELTSRSIELLEKKEIFIPFEVIAEVVYVLEKVYKINRNEISKSLNNLIKYSNIETYDNSILSYSLQFYKEKRIDFVDCLLLGYNKIKKININTFDKQLKKYLKNIGNNKI